MPAFTDQTGVTVTLPAPPQRIVSLVPSQTELLFDLDLGEMVVGITRFCIHPENEAQKVTKVGGTKKVHMERLRTLKPDLIIANKEENSKEQIEALRLEFPTWVSDVVTLEDALSMIRSVGEMTGSPLHLPLIRQIREAFSAITLPDTLRRAAYFIWKEPYMVAGQNTFINTMLTAAGLINVFDDLQRYPQITETQLVQAQPDVIILSSEPYTFTESDIPPLREHCPDASIVIADATYFSWYGSRLLRAPRYFDHLMTYLHLK